MTEYDRVYSDVYGTLVHAYTLLCEWRNSVQSHLHKRLKTR